MVEREREGKEGGRNGRGVGERGRKERERESLAKEGHMHTTHYETERRTRRQNRM